jgi:hypothetical protein
MWQSAEVQEMLRTVVVVGDWIMTLDEVKALSDKELQVKVAELCGWKLRMEQLWQRGSIEMWSAPPGADLKWDFTAPIAPPDYVSDLNAMRTAEMSLGVKKRTRVMKQLVRLVSPRYGNVYRAMCATARQHAEAFALTMGGAV